jgi:phospholipid transport system substrate-binding protein
MAAASSRTAGDCSRRQAPFFAVATAIAVLGAGHGASAASPQEAASFIAGLSSGVVEVISSSAPIDSREAQLRKLLRRGLDLDFMSRFVVGPYWREATPAQLAEYRRLFAEFILRTYAQRLADRKIDSFKITATRPTGSDDVLVTEKINRPDGPPITYGFRVHGNPPQERIIDVSVDGLSMLIGQRSDFTSVVEKSGFGGLIAALRRKMSGN